jgi:hypothetical protein
MKRNYQRKWENMRQKDTVKSASQISINGVASQDMNFRHSWFDLALKKGRFHGMDMKCCRIYSFFTFILRHTINNYFVADRFSGVSISQCLPEIIWVNARAIAILFLSTNILAQITRTAFLEKTNLVHMYE